MAALHQLRPPPPRKPAPLEIKSTPYSPSFAQSEPLLYDVPIPSATISPPSSPPARPSHLTSPTSPRTRGTHSPSRRRSVTPSGIATNELEKFAEYCRAWYFDQDDASGRLMTQTLAAILPSQRAPFSRLQASIRSAYHKSVAARKSAEFKAHLSATQPGESLTHFARTNPDSKQAKKERYERFERFIKQWATPGMPGTKPFFESLWAIMRLQTVPQNSGGAAGFKIEWEMDDAVFKEAGGKDFMLEAVSVLKGVLGFEERPSPKRTSPCSSVESLEIPEAHSRSRSQPLPSTSLTFTSIPATNNPKRIRAPSDPFIDTPTLSHSVASASTYSIGPSSSGFSSHPDEADEYSRPTTPITSPTVKRASRAYTRAEYSADILDEEELRIWTSPDLTDPEYLSLVSLFPSFITQRTLPLFPTRDQVGGRVADIEEAAGALAMDSHRIRFGTGTMWVGSKSRTEGWRGGWWTRFLLWWKRLFS